MADPVVIDCSSACSVTLQISNPLLDLTTDDGGQIALAVMAVWIVGWAFRMVIRAMREASGGASDE